MDRPQFGDDYEFPKEVHNMLLGAQAAHVQLSTMADNKASILMGSSFVVFSLTLGQMQASEVSLPLLVLGTFSFAATVLSVLTVLPAFGGHTPSSLPNHLFFGVFSKIDEQDYVDKVVGAMRSEETCYRMMARDLHQNGAVLSRHKYRYLAYAYRTFLVGIVATAATFAWQSVAG